MREERRESKGGSDKLGILFKGRSTITTTTTITSLTLIEVVGTHGLPYGDVEGVVFPS